MTIKLPPGPPRKSPEIDNKTRANIVTNALLSLRRKANSHVVELERTEENQLAKFHRGEIIIELERMQYRDRHTFRVMRAGHTLKTAAKPASLMVGYSEPMSQWTQWKEIPETRPIILALLDGFDNWCEAQTHKQNTNLRTLSETSREKVFHTVTAIYEQFELSSNLKVSIDWVPNSETKNHDARRLALSFLEAKDVVTSHKFEYGERGSIEIEIDIRQFLRIRDELLALYAPDSNDDFTPSQKESKGSTFNPFASISDLRWEEVKIRFIDGHNVRISARDATTTVDFKQMGFEDGRTHNPNQQWHLLALLAQGGGCLSWENSEASDNFKKKKQVLSDTLKAFFQIDDDPFHPYRDENAYRIKFALKADGD